jgi:hypothetical protein
MSMLIINIVFIITSEAVRGLLGVAGFPLPSDEAVALAMLAAPPVHAATLGALLELV